MIKSPAKVLALLTGLNLLNYLDRYVLSAVLPKIQEDLHLSNFTAGLLGAVFMVSYFLASPLFGSLADRGRRTPLLALGVCVWSVATVMSGLATGTVSLFVARAFVGVGEASYATIAPTLIDDLAPMEKKGRWLAIFFAATPIGSALGYLMGGPAAQAFGWRSAFFIAGGPGILLALSCLAIVEPARVLAPVRVSVLAELRPLFAGVTRLFARADAKLTSVSPLLEIPLYRAAVFGYCAQTAAVGAFAFWAPKFLYATHGLSLGRANVLFGAVTVIGGAVGTWLGGTLGDRAGKKLAGEDGMVRGYLRVSAWGGIIAAPAAMLAFLARSSTEFFVVAFICEVGLFAATSPINAAILRAVPEGRRASAMALTILLIHLLGDLWSPAAVGFLADQLPLRIAMQVLPVGIALSALFWWRVPRTKAVPSA